MTANGKVFLAWGAAADDHVTAAELDARSASGGSRPPSTSSSSASRRSPHRSSAPTATCLAALSISGPTLRLTAPRIEQLAPALVAEAARLSARLGHEELGHQDTERGAA